MKKRFVAIIVFVLCACSAYAGPFRLSWAVDGTTAGTALSANAAALVAMRLHVKSASQPTAKLSLDSVNAFDKLIVLPYNKTLDYVGTGLEVASLGSVAALATTDTGEWGTIAVMYAESVLLSNGIKDLAKAFVSRPRPYMYYDDFLIAEDWNSSFFSGHTTTAFTGAAFTSYVFSSYFPDSKWKVPVIVGSYALATATAASRIASGSHFLSDVLTGAIVGTLSGILVPYLHTLEFGKRTDRDEFVPKQMYLTASLIPDGFLIRCDF